MTETAKPSHASRWLDAAQALAVLAALVAAFRGHGSAQNVLLAVLATLPARFACDAAFRTRVGSCYRGLWDSANDPGAIPWKAALGLVSLPSAVLMLLGDTGQMGDTRPVLLTASELVRTGSPRLDRPGSAYAAARLYAADGDLPYFLRRTRSGLYSGYPLGMVPFALPFVAVSKAVGADLDNLATHARLEKWIAAWMGAGCLGLFFLVALRLVAPLPALAACLLLATGSALYSTVGQALWQHGGVVFWLLLLLLLESRPATHGSIALQGLACAMMLACRLSVAVLIVPFGAWVLLREPRRALLLVGWSVLAFSPWALLHWSIYGTVLGPSTSQMNPGDWTACDPWAWAGVLASPGRGLLVYQPWMLLAPLALLPAFRRQEGRPGLPVGWQAFCLSAIALHLALVSSWWCWWGGHCWGSRLATEVVPLAALLCLPVLASMLSSVAGRRAFAAVAVASALFHLPAGPLGWRWWDGVHDPDKNPGKLWSWREPPFLHPLRIGPRPAPAQRTSIESP